MDENSHIFVWIISGEYGVYETFKSHARLRRNSASAWIYCWNNHWSYGTCTVLNVVVAGCKAFGVQFKAVYLCSRVRCEVWRGDCNKRQSSRYTLGGRWNSVKHRRTRPHVCHADIRTDHSHAPRQLQVPNWHLRRQSLKPASRLSHSRLHWALPRCKTASSTRAPTLGVWKAEAQKKTYIQVSDVDNRQGMEMSLTMFRRSFILEGCRRNPTNRLDSLWWPIPQMNALNSSDQCFFFSRNTAYVTPKISYFYYLKTYFQDQSIQKTTLINFEKRTTGSDPIDGGYSRGCSS